MVFQRNSSKCYFHSIGRQYCVASVVLILLASILVWQLLPADVVMADDLPREILAERWTSGLANIPEHDWDTIAENIITSPHGGEMDIRRYEIECLPDRSRILWYRSQVLGNCQIQWVMLPSRKVKTVKLVPEQFEQHLRVDDLIVSPDSSTMWIRLGRSIGQSDHCAARYFKYDIGNDKLEYTDDQLQHLVDDTKGDIQSEPSHPVWARVGQEFYACQEAARKADISYTSDFWPNLQNEGPVHIGMQYDNNERHQWTLCPGLRGRGHVFDYLTGEYVCTIQLSSPRVRYAASPCFVLSAKQGPTMFNYLDGQPWKSVLKGRSSGITTIYISGFGMFVYSHDAENGYLDYITER
jgi:hypothetical protein